jgi:hypothetical protein
LDAHLPDLGFVHAGDGLMVPTLRFTFQPA